MEKEDRMTPVVLNWDHPCDFTVFNIDIDTERDIVVRQVFISGGYVHICIYV